MQTQTHDTQARPFIKWVGGKTQLLEEVRRALPADIAFHRGLTYVEPFVGGGAVLFWILQQYPNIEHAVINDINQELICTYRVIKTDVEALISELSTLQREYLTLDADSRKEYFLDKRAQFNTKSTAPTTTAALFIFLNRTCFNGLYRVNAKGLFNVPHGRYANPRICDADNLHAVSRLLQKVDILCGDFADTGRYAGPDTLYYFDPPYKPITETSSFTSYAKDGFSDTEQIRLRDFCNQISESGAMFIDCSQFKQYNYIFYSEEGHCISPALNNVENFQVLGIEKGHNHEHDLLVGGFPCQDYSVATTLKRSGGIDGKKGVLWWQIYRIIQESKKRPEYLLFENVDRLLKSPASQRGRDFAIILASLNDLGYTVEWRVINAADYGMPQRRRRTYIVAYYNTSAISQSVVKADKWILNEGTIAMALPVRIKEGSKLSTFYIDGQLEEVSSNFNKGKEKYEFENAGIAINRKVTTVATLPVYEGERLSLGQLLLPENKVPDDFFISNEDLPKWQYLKGSKSEVRKSADGYEYKYTEGSMSFPDALDKPSRTIITGEGGNGPSRFKHVILTESGRYRRLTPIELERLNMFPDNHTEGVSDIRRAFLMGNALVTGIVEKIGLVLLHKIDTSACRLCQPSPEAAPPA